MTRKEELKKQLEELTKSEVRLNEERINTATIEVLEKVEGIHKKRMGIWQEITKINKEEQQTRGHI